jgi:putative lipoic acid-binding regulatory protein
MARTPKDYTKLRQLLEEQETFPLSYLHKFIGRNSPAFAQGLAELEQRFPDLKKQTARKSQGDAHLAMTYVYVARNVDDVIVLLEATDQIEDLLVVL